MDQPTDQQLALVGFQEEHGGYPGGQLKHSLSAIHCHICSYPGPILGVELVNFGITCVVNLISLTSVFTFIFGFSFSGIVRCW